MTRWARSAALCAVILGAGGALAAADAADDAMAVEEAFWAARKAGDVKRVRELLAPDFESVESDCNGLQFTQGATTTVSRLEKDLAEGSYGSYKIRRMGAQVAGLAVILTVGWQSRYAPRVGGVRAVRYTSGVATVVWAKDQTGRWRRFHYHSHWRRIHTHAFAQKPNP
jgi:ketosteroid isomerase-like protein